MHIYTFTGAGLSADSGLSTFRQNGDGHALWDNYNIAEVCYFGTYKENKDKIFQFYSDRKQEILKAEPNAAHYALAKLNEIFPEQVTHLTQNIDDLLERAGCKNVIHLHGNIHEMICYGCGNVWNIGDAPYTLEMVCPNCSCFRAIKPNVVFFGEKAPNYIYLKKLYKNLKNNDYFIAIGTSFQVISPEALLKPSRFGHSKNIQINMECHYSELFGENLEGAASVKVPELVDDIIREGL